MGHPQGVGHAQAGLAGKLDLTTRGQANEANPKSFDHQERGRVDRSGELAAAGKVGREYGEARVTMQRMGHVAPDVRRAVLEEVNQILTGQPLPDEDVSPWDEDLFGRIRPELPGRIDPDALDWGSDLGPSGNRP